MPSAELRPLNNGVNTKQSCRTSRGSPMNASGRGGWREQWGQYEAKLPDIPRLADERQRSWWLAGIVCGWSEEEALLAEFRESLEIHHRERWREQHKRCFGFCIETNRREEIFPSAAP